MRFRHFLPAGCALWLLAAALPGQTPAAAPAFEVASIKPAPPLDPAKIVAGKMHVGMKVDAARVDIGNLSLADLIRIAYRLKPYQLTGPDWMAAQRFDVLAKIPDGGSKDKVPEMLQALLAERFRLAIHRESKDDPVYALVVGKSGAKLKAAEPDAPAPPAAEPAPPPPGATVIGQGEGKVTMKPNRDGKGMTVAGQFGQMKMSMIEGGLMRMEFSKMNMTALADLLSRFADRPVIDMTELKGNYQVALELSMEEMRAVARAAAQSAGIMLPGPGPAAEAGRAPGDAASAPSATSIFTAMQALGLKLEARKAPLERVVVDHLEKTPTEN